MIVCTSTNILFERADGTRIDVRDSMRICAEAGYRYLDFCFVDQVINPFGTPFLTDVWEEYIRDIADLAKRLNVSFVQSHLPICDFYNVYQSAANERSFEIMRRGIIGSAMIGAKWAVAHPLVKTSLGNDDENMRDRNVRYFSELARLAKENGIGIAIENMWGTTENGEQKYATDPQELCELIDAIDRDNVGACWDTMHGSIERIDQPNAIRLLGGRLKATHISDEKGKGFIHRLPYTGNCDWKGILRALRDIRYEDAFAFELQHYLRDVPREEILSLLKKSLVLGNEMISIKHSESDGEY